MTVAAGRTGSAMWAPQRRGTTIGVLLLVTVFAFEAMSLGTALPTMVRELDGEALYSWPFTAFLAASVVGTVLAGWLSDTRGPRLPLLGAPAVFTVGLALAALAPNMAVLLAGRVLQGLGAGVGVVVIYVLVAQVYEERDRPAAFGLISAAWVLPSLIGPTVAGLLTQHASWRWVFGGLVPVVLLAAALLVPVARQLPPHGETAHSETALGETAHGETAPGDTAARPAERPVRRGVLLAALGASAGLSALTWAAQHPTAGTAVLAAAGVVVLVPSLRRVLPARTVTAGRGLPTIVLSRGLLTGAFFGVEAYLPLTLTAVHDLSPAMAGLPLTIGALGWSAASAWQGRHPDYRRDRLLRAGFLMLATGLAGTTLVASETVTPWVVLPFWAVAGLGMGLAMPSLSVRLLELSPAQDRGFNSAALQIWDMLMAAACIGLGGVLLVGIASTAAPSPAVLVLGVLMVGVALLGAALASRTRTATLDN